MDPRKLHQIDQETGPLHELAIKLSAYYRSLQEQGFTPAEALHIVTDYQRTLILTVTRKDTDGR